MKFSILLLLAVAGTVCAQPLATQIEQARQLDRQVTPSESATTRQTPLLPGQALDSDSEASDDLGVQVLMKRQEKRKTFQAFGDAFGIRTSNVALSRRDAAEDYLLVSNFGITAQPALSRTIDAEFTARTSLFRYNEFSALDFQSLDLGGGLAWRIPKLWNVALLGRYNYTSLFGAHTGSQFFDNHTFTAGLQKTFSLGRAHSVSVGYTSTFGFADPKEAQRNEHGVFAGYHVNITRSLEADLSYRVARHVYTSGNRQDTNHTVSASVKYNVTSYASVAAFASYAENHSDRSAFDYKVGNVGIGAAVLVRF